MKASKMRLKRRNSKAQKILKNARSWIPLVPRRHPGMSSSRCTLRRLRGRQRRETCAHARLSASATNLHGRADCAPAVLRTLRPASASRPGGLRGRLLVASLHLRILLRFRLLYTYPPFFRRGFTRRSLRRGNPRRLGRGLEDWGMEGGLGCEWASVVIRERRDCWPSR